MSEWLDIESAPKDGSYIDVWTSYDERVTDVVWRKNRLRWEHWSIGGFDTMEWVKVDGKPTHWMPTPKSPEQS